MSKNLKILIVGFGNIGKNHYRVANEIGLETYVLDIKRKIPKQFYDISQIKKNNIFFDGIVIATDIHQHYKSFKDLVNFSNNFLIEKPVCLNLKDANKIYKLSKKQKKNIYVSHTERYNSVILKIKKLINKNKIYHLNFNRIGPIPKDGLNYGVGLDLAVHDLDLLNYLIGSKITFKSILKNKVRKKKFEDSMNISLKLANGVTSNIYVNWVSPVKKRSISISSYSNHFQVDLLNRKILKSSKFNFYKNKSLEEKIFVNQKKEPLYLQMNDFKLKIQNNKRQLDIALLKDSIKTLKTLDDL